MNTTLLHWPEVIEGAEEEVPDSSQAAGDEQSNDDADQSHEDSEDEPDEPEELTAADRAALLEALRKEREARRQYEKKVRQQEQAQREAELAEQGELAQAQAKLQEANQRNEQLLNGIRRDRVNRAIEKAAEKLRFIDLDDALAQTDRQNIQITEDEDELFIIDQASVEAAVKALATKKPHLVRVGTEDGGPSGSGFGAKGRKKTGASEEEILERYPALKNQ